MTEHIKELMPSRPDPVMSETDIVKINKNFDAAEVLEHVKSGGNVLITDFYSTGLNLLSELKKYLKTLYSETEFKKQRVFRDIFHKYSQHIFLEVKAKKLVVRKSPDIGWLEILYPDISDFMLRFTDVQGMNSSWQWYKKGVFIPILGRKIYPYYGTYFPTRFEHLELFANWLKSYKGDKNYAYDVGAGSGILSYRLLMSGFDKVFASDNNVNAIIGLYNEVIRRNLAGKINVECGDLFAGIKEKSELIVFNPPWIPAQNDIKGLDNAIYYEKDMFSRFFEEAYHRLDADGQIVIIFSNLAKITNICDVNPIEEELNTASRYKLNLFKTAKVGQASKKTKRNQSWRDEELTELWVLGKQ